MYERYSFSTSLLPFGIVTIFYFRCSPRCTVYFIRVLICISLGTSGVEYLFIFLFAHHVFSLMKYLIFCQFSNWNLKYYYYCWVLRFVLNSRCETCVRYIGCKYFLQFWNLSFHSLNMLFTEHEHLNLIKSRLSVFFFFRSCSWYHV